MGRKFLVVALVVSIVGCTLAMSKPNDAQILTRVGKVAANKIGDALPESSKMAGPVNALRNNDLLPVSERVKLRMRTDKSMEGANILVIVDGGDVKLRAIGIDHRNIPSSTYRWMPRLCPTARRADSW